MATVHIRRCDGPGAEPRWVSYEVPLEDRMTVLGVLDYIYENVDTSLAYYQSCRMGRCAGCFVQVNGKGVLSCETTAFDGMRVGPLENYELVRDLVVDLNTPLKNRATNDRG
jgi:succinate dehydrogenase/fumarate reductase iron-sulfur protein